MASATAADTLGSMRDLFASGAELLRQHERAVLPFAREPWTQLRRQAERIVACLEGKSASVES